MTQARIEWAPDALYNVRRSPETQAAINGLAARMAEAAGPGFEWSSMQGARRPQGRWRAIVYALFECWADDEDGAEELANVVRAVLKSSPGHWAHNTFIRWWKENSGPYSWPDASDQVRFQFTGEILLKI